MSDTTQITDPKSLQPGTRLVSKWGRHEVVLLHRKKDDSGWWNTDGSGFVDSALTSGDWSIGDESETE